MIKFIKETIKYFGQHKAQEGFVEACNQGDVKTINLYITKNPYKDHIQKLLPGGLSISCQKGHLEALEFFVSAVNMDESAKNSAAQEGLLLASANGHLPVVKLLLNSPDITVKPDLHKGNDFIFQTALVYERMDVLRYFIFDLNIEKTPGIDAALKEHKKDSVTAAENWFKVRDLNTQLESELPNTGNDKVKRNKL